MKTRNVDLEHSHILTNHICKHIILEAPTIPELEKKIKNYESILVRAITNVYKISNLTLANDGSYNISPNQSYQTGIFFSFDGKRKEEVSNPEGTLHYLRQLASLESKKQQKSHVIKPSNLHSKEVPHADTLTIEIDSESRTDDIISSKQREFIEHLISITNLKEISFFTKSKSKDPNTDKNIVTMSVNYKIREIQKKQQPKEEPEAR